MNLLKRLFCANKNQRKDFEAQRIMSKCVKCGKEFPAVTYAVSKSTYGVGVPEFMKEHQNGDLEFFEKRQVWWLFVRTTSKGRWSFWKYDRGVFIW